MTIELKFTLGTLEIWGIGKDNAAILPRSCLWDERTACFRAPASQYAPVVMALLRAKQPYEDSARRYEVLKDGLQVRRIPRPYQEEKFKRCDELVGTYGRGGHYRYVWKAQGLLALKISNMPYGAKARQSWNDTRNQKIGTCLRSFLKGLLAASNAIREDRLERERCEREQREAEARPSGAGTAREVPW